MSRLDELKSGMQEEIIDIDMTADIDGVNNKNTKQRINISGGSTRKKISPYELSKELGNEDEDAENKEENLVQDPEAYTKNILYGEDSIFEKWKKDKLEEMSERLDRFDDEREELIEEGKLDPKDIKDDDYAKNLSNDSEESEDDDSSSDDIDDNLVLDKDDLFANDEDSDESDEEEEEDVEDVTEEIEEDSDEEDEDTVEEIKEETEKPKEEKSSEDNEVHITEEDKELFDTIGRDVDSSKFLDDDDDEESSKENKNVEVLEEDDDEEKDDTDNDANATLNHLKELITNKLQPTFKKLDINQFKIVSKKSGSTNIKSITNGQQLKVVKWVLPNQKQCVFMKQFTGLELQSLSENIQEGSTTSMNIAYRMIYDHIVSNKPEKFTDWLTVTPDSDIDHYMFCVFLASYKGSNYLPITCTNSNCPDSTFLTDDINVMDMVKFKDDESKNEFTKIYKSDIVYSNSAGYYVTAITPVSNNIAISFKESTLKDVIDAESLDDRFRTKYRTTIGLLPYIDTIYKMDVESQTLEEIKYTEFDSNIKTLRTKIKKYSQLIDTLSSDEFGVISAIIQAITSRTDMISYIIPEIECPACGTKIAEAPTSATQLVFTRYQLGALVNTSLN